MNYSVAQGVMVKSVGIYAPDIFSGFSEDVQKGLLALGYRPFRSEDPTTANLIISSPSEISKVHSTRAIVAETVVVYPRASQSEYEALASLVDVCRLVHPDIMAEEWATSTTKAIDAFHCYNGKTKADWICSEEHPDVTDELCDTFRKTGLELSHGGFLTRYTDGCFSARSKSGSMLTTRTGLDKRQIEKHDLVHVTSVADKRFAGSSVGGVRPSSSTPWHFAIYEAFPNVSHIVHGHCKRVTYSPNLAKYRTKHYSPYGTRSVFESVFEILQAHPFGILAGHGEVAVGSSFSDCMKNYRHFQGIALA